MMKSLWDIPRHAFCPIRPLQTAIGRVFAAGHPGAWPPIGTLLGSAPVFVPTGQPDNSPAFQRRVLAGTGRVPPGRLNGRHIVSAIANDFDLQTSVVPAGLGSFAD